ncbi:MAG: alpha-amylase family glycosyl hydrolase, partial [Christensenellales bacterium]|nr:alpha-amylase family glycosyl hydrolase [Christensenellales bacterium]
MKRIILWVLALMLTMTFASAEEIRTQSCNWYEVFVRSYQDGDGDRIGDLKGLMSRLDYIADMGYDGLWLMPIMPSPSYHKYDVKDYCAIDPQYGTLDDFKALVSACHERGIRIIVDLPVNHTSVSHPWFTQACTALRKKETDNPYIDYYCFSEKGGQKMIPVPGTSWFYEEQFSGGGMPDLNLDSKAVRSEIRNILDFWLNECGADGFRLDAVTSYYA